ARVNCKLDRAPEEVEGMRNIPTLFMGAAIALACTGGMRAVALAQGPAANGPLKLSEHVTVVLQGQPGAMSNVGIVVGSRGTFVVDSGLCPGSGRNPATRAGRR